MFDILAAIFAPLIEAIVSFLAAILAPILTPVFELIALIIGAILHFLFALLANLLGASWMAAHTRGLKRVGYLMIALSSAHLLAAILLPITGSAPAALLSWVFAPFTLLASALVLLLGAVLVVGTRASKAKTTNAAPQPILTESVSTGVAKELVSHGMAVVFAIAVFIGVAAISSAQSERKSLREKLCDGARTKYEETVSEGWRARISKAVRFGEDKLGPERAAKLREKHPCPKIE